MSRKGALFCVLVLVLCLLCCCDELKREYKEDIIYTLNDCEDSIIIKEWCFLLGSGAEIYYKESGKEPVLIGKTTGGDNGYCPFEDGQYSITQIGNSICVSWCFRPSNYNNAVWRTETFLLPEDTDN